MIQKNTLALIVVASMAPTIRNAARPANRWQASHAAKPTTTISSPATVRSPFWRKPNTRQMASYTNQNTTRKATAVTPAATGDQSSTCLSTRKVPAFHRYSTENSAKPDSQVE